MMTCSSQGFTTRFEKQKQMRCFWELRSSSSCGELSSFLQTWDQNGTITELFTNTENTGSIKKSAYMYQFKEDSLITNSLSAMAKNNLHLSLSNKPSSNGVAELGSTYYDDESIDSHPVKTSYHGTDDATIESQPIEIGPMRELWDAAIGYALEQNKILKEQEKEFKLKSDRKLNSPWTPSINAVSPKFEFGTCDPNFSNKIPTCVHLELNHEKETFVKVEQRKQEWDAKLSPSSVMSGSASPGTPSGVTGNQDQWSNLGSSKCQTSKEVKREVVLKEMHNDKEKENDLKRKQVLLFKQKQAPAPPVVVIKEKEKDVTDGVLEPTNNKSSQLQKHPESVKIGPSDKNNQSTTITNIQTTTSLSIVSTNIANKTSGNFHRINRISKDQTQNSSNSEDKSLMKHAPLESNTDGVTKYKVQAMPNVKTKKAPPPPTKKIDDAIINTFQHGGTEGPVIIIEKM